jgi:hypothetical protein
VREIPVRHDLDAWLRAYLDVAGISGQDDKLPLFRAADGKRRQLTPAAYRAHSMRQMLKRQLEDAGLPPPLLPAQLPGRGGDRSAQSERAFGGRAVPRRPFQSQDHPDLRSRAPARDAQHCGADFDLRRQMNTSLMKNCYCRWRSGHDQVGPGLLTGSAKPKAVADSIPIYGTWSFVPPLIGYRFRARTTHSACRWLRGTYDRHFEQAGFKALMMS